MNLATLQTLVERKSGQPPEYPDDAGVAPLQGLLGHLDINEYVRYCLPRGSYQVCGIAVLGLSDIIDEMHPEAGPGGIIRRFGYLIVASSAGGNVVCFHCPTGKVYWADHESFADGCICYQDRSTGEWVFLEEYLPENVERAMVPLADNIEQFLAALLSEQLEAQLRALDLSPLPIAPGPNSQNHQ